MREARNAHKEDSFADMLCLLVYYFGIDDEDVLEMPYLRAEIMLDWLAEFMKTQSKAGGGFSGGMINAKGTFK